MTPEDHATSSATELVAAVQSGTVSARELLETYLGRIERFDRGRVNAVVTLAAERARAEADAADRALARGDELGPLHGLPTTVKDAIATARLHSTGRAVELADHVSATSTTSVGYRPGPTSTCSARSLAPPTTWTSCSTSSPAPRRRRPRRGGSTSAAPRCRASTVPALPSGSTTTCARSNASTSAS